MSWNKDYNENNNEQSSAHLLRMRSILDFENIRKEAYNYPLKFLIEDICESEIKIDLSKTINYFVLIDAEDEAKACLNIQLRCRHLYGHNLVNWLQKIIDCFSNIIVDHIQRNLNETIIQFHPTKKHPLSLDRAPFIHLEYMHINNTTRNKIGSYFNSIYEDLNNSKHRFVRNQANKIIRQKINFIELKDNDIYYAKNALLNLQEEFTSFFSNFKINN
jgi:hypothetical protein